MPVKLLQLFNLAVNFLTQFCNTTIVLCTGNTAAFGQAS